LGIAIAQIALDHFTVGGHKMHGAKGAYRNTGAATNAFIIIDLNACHFHVPRQGLGRAGNRTWRILTLLAGQGDIDPLGFPFNDAYAGASGIGHMVVLHGADEFAQPAPGALIVICFQNFVVVHGQSPYGPALQQVRGLVFQAELFQGFRFWDAVRVKTLVGIELVYHLDKLLFIDLSAYDAGSSPP
jgi:hypothetical protein